MSDFSQGPGWWQASDGKWYPPEQAPGAPATPPPAGPPGYGAAPGYGAPQGGGGGVGVGEIVGYGWKKFQEYVGQIIVAIIIYAVVVGVFAFIGNIIQTQINSAFGSIIFSLINLVVSSAISIILIRAVLAVVDGKQIDTAELFSSDNLGPYIIGSVLFALGAWIGLILCIIPGLIFMFLASFWNFYIVDKSLEPMDAIKASIDLVKNNVGPVLVWAIVSTLIVLAGLVVCFVGAIVAIPVVYIGHAYLYRRLNNEPVAP